MSQPQDSLGGGPVGFPSTEWSVVDRVQGSSLEDRKQALGQLFERYQKPIYHYVRHKWSKSPEDARELTSDFFVAILDCESLKRYQPGVASFRNYLKGILRNIARDQLDAARALKRGGGVRIISLPESLEESIRDSGTTDPEEALDWAWRGTICDKALERTRRWFKEKKRETQFRTFEEAVLKKDGEPLSDREVGERLSLPESTVGNHKTVVRDQLRAEIRAELLKTVLNRDQLEEEYRLIIGESGL